MTKEITRRLTALEARQPHIRNFEEFAEIWADMDELSKSLYEFALNCPEYDGGRNWEVIRGYLLRVGLQPPGEPFSLKAIAAELKSDD